MEDNKKLTDEQVKEVQAIVKSMFAPKAGDKKISQLDPMSPILDNDLLAMVDIADEITKKATALQIKTYVGVGQKEFDATVGEVGSGSDYNDINTAAAASKFNLLVIGNFTQPTNIIGVAGLLSLTIAERLTFTSANINIGSGGLRMRGKILHTNYASGTHTLFNGNTVLLDIDNVTFLDTSSGATVKLGNVSGGIHVIHNCKFILPNNAACGFYNAGAGSSFTNLGVNGGGSSCKNFIDTAEQVIVNNIYFEPDIFENGAVMIKIGSPSKENPKAFPKISTIDNVVCGLGTATMIVTVGSPSTQVSNINGGISLEYAAVNCNTTNCSVIDFIFTGNTDANYFVNCKAIGNTPITIGGDNNQFVSCDLTAAVTLSASSNDNQFLLCKSTGGFTDNGTNNLFLAGTSGNFINSSYSGFGGSTAAFPALKFKRHEGTMPAAGNNLTVTAATLGLTSARQIAIGRLEAKGTDNLWFADGNNILSTTKCDFIIPGAGHANDGDLLISTGVGATLVAGQPFKFIYGYQATNFLDSEAKKAKAG